MKLWVQNTKHLAVRDHQTCVCVSHSSFNFFSQVLLGSVIAASRFNGFFCLFASNLKMRFQRMFVFPNSYTHVLSCSASCSIIIILCPLLINHFNLSLDLIVQCSSRLMHACVLREIIVADKIQEIKLKNPYACVREVRSVKEIGGFFNLSIKNRDRIYITYFLNGLFELKSLVPYQHMHIDSLSIIVEQICLMFHN